MKHVVSNSSPTLWWIRQSILQALAEQSRIVVSLNKIGSINKINKMYALLEQSNESTIC
jgi:RNA polymerase primary sigma factor